jgi:Hinge domain of cleavage stimulation factor subunit 2
VLVSALQLHEAWDLLESMKKMVDDDRGRARSLLEAHPQLIGAFIEVQVSKYVCAIMCAYEYVRSYVHGLS